MISYDNEKKTFIASQMMNLKILGNAEFVKAGERKLKKIQRALDR